MDLGKSINNETTVLTGNAIVETHHQDLTWSRRNEDDWLLTMTAQCMCTYIHIYNGYHNRPYSDKYMLSVSSIHFRLLILRKVIEKEKKSNFSLRYTHWLSHKLPKIQNENWFDIATKIVSLLLNYYESLNEMFAFQKCIFNDILIISYNTVNI